MKKLSIILISTLMLSTFAMAQSNDEKDIRATLETLRNAMMSADKAALEKIADDGLTYGHSSGLMEDKTAFVNSIASRKFEFKKIEFPDVSVKMLENGFAIVRHKITGDTANDGKPATVNIGVMLVMHKIKGDWKIVARQAYKL
ncbi:MAG TPA: nuclear transport factor 2 family protein [Chryseolinea sp.]|nr:nuclear transport factor 2 family protein [Chryseolinea sp.]